MKYQLLIYVDQLFKPLYVVAKKLKFNAVASHSKPHFIVLKFFGIGSITRIAHVINVLGLPKHKITFITLQQNKPIINLLQLNAIYINTKHPKSLLNSLINIITHVWKTKNATVVDMERTSNISGLFRLFIGIRKKCHAFYFKSKNSKTSSQLFVSLHNKPATYAIAEMFNTTYKFKDDKHHIPNTSNKIFININAGDYLPERKFSLLKYAQLIKTLLQKNTNWCFYLTGSPSEFTYVQSFINILKNNNVPLKQIVNIAGTCNLSQFVTSLKEAKLFITNDSGPLHLSYHFGVKTVAIWGPTSAKLVGYKNSTRMLNLHTEIECTPCFKHPKSNVAKTCSGKITCFAAMNIEEMATKISSFVER